MADAGTAQNIPVFAKFIILALCIIAVVLTAGWSKFVDMIKGSSKKKTTQQPPAKQ